MRVGKSNCEQDSRDMSAVEFNQLTSFSRDEGRRERGAVARVVVLLENHGLRDRLIAPPAVFCGRLQSLRGVSFILNYNI